MADLTPARRRALVSVLARALLADARERVAREQQPANDTAAPVEAGARVRSLSGRRGTP